jgi:hypothetical protein
VKERFGRGVSGRYRDVISGAGSTGTGSCLGAGVFLFSGSAPHTVACGAKNAFKVLGVAFGAFELGVFIGIHYQQFEKILAF